MFAQLKGWDKLDIKDIVKKMGANIYEIKTGYAQVTLDAFTVTSIIKSLQDLHKDLHHYQIICKVTKKMNESQVI